MTTNMNPEQAQAVNLHGLPLVIFAPPGSGKTHVIATKIQKLVVEMGVPPEKVLALSFTNKASTELKERVAHMCDMEPRRFSNILTFHSLCLRLLKTYAAKTPLLNASFCILDPDDSKTMLKDILADLGSEENPSKVMRAMDREWRNHGIEPQDAVSARSEAHRVYSLYWSSCLAKWREAKVVDFNDLLTHTITLLSGNDAVLEECRTRKYWYLLVDEFQDTNPAQMKLVHLLVGRTMGGRPRPEEERVVDRDAPRLTPDNLTVVGDDYQAIYRFRGSTIRNILDFTSMYPTATQILLSINYRSLPEIIRASASLIAKNANQVHKDVVSGRAGEQQQQQQQQRVTKLVSLDAAAEAQQLVRIVSASSEKVAVLTRTNTHQGDCIPSALRRAGIAYRIVGAAGFFSKKEVRAALSLCTFLMHPTSFDHAFLTCIDSMSLGVGPKTLDKIKARAKASAVGLWAASMALARENKRVNKMVEAMLELVDAAQDAASAGGAREFMTSLLEPGPVASSLVDMAQDGELIQDFLDRCHLCFDVEAEGGSDDDQVRVLIMTAHKSKGLEFPVVFIPGCIEGVFPSAFCRSSADVEEERRLFFVAMTRARNRLYMSSTRARPTSRFLAEF